MRRYGRRGGNRLASLRLKPETTAPALPYNFFYLEEFMKQQGFTLRKGLFSGLTILLITVFIYLAVQSNRLEKERLKRDTNAVETFKPTPVRSLRPRDLEITGVFLEPRGSSGAAEAAGTRNRIEVRNSGEATYSVIRFHLDYMDAGGKKLETVVRDMAEKIPPGVTELSFEIPPDEIPAGAVGFIPSIVFADIEPGGS